MIDHALKEELDKMADRKARQNKPPQEAITEFRRLATVELPIAIDRYPQSRYSLIEAVPKTGRKHQIRWHMKHVAHPIIGDAKHGTGNYNRYFAEHFGADRLSLACTSMEVKHPASNNPLLFKACLDGRLTALMHGFGWLNDFTDYLYEKQY